MIVGAGPAGISATLRAIERGLRYVTLERDEIGGTVSKYPRQKLVMTSPVELPLYGRFRKTELSKEELLAIWRRLLAREDVSIRTGEPVQSIEGRDGLFEVVTERSAYRARAVVLALGRAGTPRKLGIPGEELPKVMYRLIEADHYTGKRLLVVGGGDSAVEAAMGLASQPGNDVTLSYRQDRFSRIKERNAHRLEACRRAGKLRVLLRSHPVCFTPDAAILEVDGARQELPNDFAWIFAGGVPPNGFLKAIGVAFGARDLTVEAGREAREAAGARAAARQAVTRASEDPSAAATSSSRTGLKSS
ncbi:MAG: NAD(P)-binding domain-containing protein [Acidobacteriota bacterium]